MLLKEAEGLGHLFLHCDFANQDWIAAGILGLQFCLHKNIDNWMLEGLAA